MRKGIGEKDGNRDWSGRKGKGFERKMRKGTGEKDRNRDWSGGREKNWRF